MSPSPQIANVLLVGIDYPLLINQLNTHGYTPLSVSDMASVASIGEPYAVVGVGEDLVDRENFDFEQLYFLGGGAPAAALIADPRRLGPVLRKVLTDGTLDWLHAADIENGMACGRIDRMVIGARLNDNFKALQRGIRERERLTKEIHLRDHILNHERELNANLMGSITSGLLIIDLKGIVIMLNENFRTIFKLTEAEYVGGPYGKVLRGKLRTVVEDYLKRVHKRPLHHEIKKISMERTVIEIALYKMCDNNQNVNGVLVLLNDVTDQENTTQQLYRAEKLATMGTMLSGIAHELRNPLAIISARAQMALTKETWERDWIVKNYQSIEAQTYRCAAIINNLLDFTRYRATQMALHAIEEILDETLTYVEYQNAFDAVVIDKQYLPGLSIYGDRSRFVQVFLNVISNASDAMNGKGRLTLKTRLDGEGYVLVEINDTGAGIDPAIKNKVFDPFFTTKAPGKGTGLGL
ncbi:MAG TPA: ATP-binding protein, partial [Chitinivibrionales bacterium]